eukprot:TRINITY_DN8475_c0_g1_i1.p1 TRINITY_DN8475_c0_g1~~TRINITY_DN8475_c0_g1_i1.p1  ORF type:complete len:650 (-),score=151.01 TRINITY_DN8475_c0_g1_i1:117-2066(-)
MGAAQNKELNRTIQNLPPSKRPPSNPKKEEYDIVIDITRIRDGSTGWPIILSSKWKYFLHETYAKLINYKKEDDFGQDQDSYYNDSEFKGSSPKVQKPISPNDDVITKQLLQLLDFNQTNTLVSVSGLFNRGKTFLLNKLAKTALPSDYKVTTKGLSFVLPFDDNVKNLIFLDTAGTNSPLMLAHDESTNRLLIEKKSTELFLQDLVFAMSDVIIVVVNQLTWPDQEYLEVLQDKLRKSNKEFRQLYVVHNFYDVRTERDLLLMWRKHVLRSYAGSQKTVQVNLENGPQPARYFVTKGQTVSHVFLANDNSPAGKLWNPRTIELIRTWLKGKHASANKPLPDIIVEHVQRWLGDYCKEVKSVKIKKNFDKEVLDGNPPLGVLGNHQVENEELHPTPNPEIPVIQRKPSTVIVTKGKTNSSNKKSSPTPSAVQTPVIVPSREEIPLPESDWDKMPAEIPKKEKVLGPFSLVVEGNLDLIKEKIEYHGYHITLSQVNQFQPAIDIVEDSNGMTIIVDLPGFRPDEDEDSGEQKQEKTDSVTGGNVNVTIDRKIRNVIITGNRQLCFPKIESVGEHDFSFGEIRNYEQGPDCERTFGTFERRVPIPDKYEIDTNPFFTLDEGQGIIFLKTAKKQQKVKAVRITKSIKNKSSF